MFNCDIIDIITFAEQLCIIKKKLFSLLVDKNNAHQVHKYDVKIKSIFLYPNVLSKDVSKQTKGTKN